VIDNLDKIIDRIQAHLQRKNEIRDITLRRSRELIRFCANSIRATHRHEYGVAGDLLCEASQAAKTMSDDANQYADIYYAGYTQDALKELAEAACTLRLVAEGRIADPDELHVPYPAFLNGLGEAIGEMRRYALDCIRRDDTTEAERILGIMDDVYGQLVTIDFPDSMTRGLRRTTDMVRGVTERTRGDLTTAMRQEQLQEALRAFESRLDARDE